MRQIYLGIFMMVVISSRAQPGIWTWVHGDTAQSQAPVRGTQGVFHPDNRPRGVYEGAEWKDKQGKFWYWEPSCYECDGVSGWGNDLWSFDPAANMWAWMKGNAVANDLGSFGLLGVKAEDNLPPARGFGAASWVDTAGVFWMYGGGAHIGQWRYWADLWRFDPETNNWTWMNGTADSGVLPSYGLQGIPSPSNHPGSRNEMIATWVDQENNLWLFGGVVGNGDNRGSDLWRYSIATNEWTWMKGPMTFGYSGSYGQRGVEDQSNNPRARVAATSWVDKSGKLWLFGGQGLSSQEVLNDLWSYDPMTNNWTWVHGPPGISQDPGSIGPVCVSADSLNPISRFECRVRWVDIEGDLWMWGGGTIGLSQSQSFLNDLWRYRIEDDQWTLMWPDSLYDPFGNFGTKGQASPCNRPYGAKGALSWYQEETNTVYLFAGHQFYPPLPSSVAQRSVMWKYVLDPQCIQYSCPPICDPLQIELELQQPDQENEGGALVSVENGVAPYSYSLDSLNYQPENAFAQLQPGVYDLFVLDAFGCPGSTTFSIDPVVPTDPAEGVLISQANDHLVISVDRALRFRLFDVIGRLVLDQGLSEGTIQIFTGRMASGIYIFHFSEIGSTGKIFIN